MELFKTSVFIPLQSKFCISTATFCLPSQILILFEIHIEMLGALALVYADAPCQSSNLTDSRRPQII